MSLSEKQMRELAEKLGECMSEKSLMLASAESCTGGWLAKIITDIPGSSAWFAGSVVSYSNGVKNSILDVKPTTLKDFGAVSGETVMAMSEGLFAHTNADLVVSISGIAGPGGGSEDKPVGLVWMNWGRREESMFARSYHFEGEREDVRKQAVAQALNNLLDCLDC